MGENPILRPLQPAEPNEAAEGQRAIPATRAGANRARVVHHFGYAMASCRRPV